MTRLLTPFFLVASAAFSVAADDAHQLFVDKCGVCHGGDATGSDRGPGLTNNRRLRTRSETEIGPSSPKELQVECLLFRCLKFRPNSWRAMFVPRMRCGRGRGLVLRQRELRVVS